MQKKRGIDSSRARHSRSNKSQAAVEYLMIAGIAFLITVPMMYILYQYTSEMSSDVAQSKVGKVGTDIINTAEQIFYLGEPSRTTLRFDMPEGVHDIYVAGDRTIVFVLGDVYSKNEVTIFSNVDIVSYLIPRDFAKGRHNFRIEAERDHVALYSGDKEMAILESYAYNLFKMFMRRAGDAISDKPLVEGSGYKYTLNDIRDERDKAYISAAATGIDVSAIITIQQLDGPIQFFIGDIQPGLTERSLEIKIDPSGFDLQGGITPTILSATFDDDTFSIGKYNLNITTSPSAECFPNGLCPDLPGTDYVLLIVRESDSEGPLKIVAYAEASTVSAPTGNWYFGDVSLSAKTIASIDINPDSSISAISIQQTLSQEITEPISSFLFGFYDISIADGSMSFNITTPELSPDETTYIGLPVSFRTYYPITAGPTDTLSGEYLKDSSCTFSFTRAGASVQIGGCGI